VHFWVENASDKSNFKCGTHSRQNTLKFDKLKAYKGSSSTKEFAAVYNHSAIENMSGSIWIRVTAALSD